MNRNQGQTPISEGPGQSNAVERRLAGEDEAVGQPFKTVVSLALKWVAWLAIGVFVFLLLDYLLRRSGVGL